jgi:peptide methionine sulfoxide reductase msrA/msrB
MYTIYKDSVSYENPGVRPMIKVTKPDREWKEVLTRDEYRVLRKGGTERPFSGKYNEHHEKGVYVCAACRTPLFPSETKYDHGTGWPSFWAPADGTHLEYREDTSHGMRRTEVRCGVCGSHLGHVFDDGPEPTRKHYCINSVAMRFTPAGPPAERPGAGSPAARPPSKSPRPAPGMENSAFEARAETATFAAGCFWGVEDKFRGVQGVLRTRVGYAGGGIPSPTYEMVCTDKTGHAESVEVIFDPTVVSYERLLEFFFLFHDPTQVNRQGPDVGTQYRSVIFYHDEKQKAAALRMIESLNRSGRYDKPLATQVVPAETFYEAEPYHQQYKEKIRKGL